MKDIEEALNYEGDDQAYETLEDDFFSKLLEGGNIKSTSGQTNKQKNINEGFKKKKDGKIDSVEVKETAVKYNHDQKWDDIDQGEDEEQFYEENDDYEELSGE